MQSFFIIKRLLSIHYDITEYNVTNHKTLKEKYKSKSFQYYKKGMDIIIDI